MTVVQQVFGTGTADVTGAARNQNRLAGEAERWLKKPVIAINTATYWYAMRANGMDDIVEGFGSLLTDFRELPKSYLETEAGRMAIAS